MASWVSGYKAVGGYFEGEVFNTHFGNVDNVPWGNPPGLYGFCSWNSDSLYLNNGHEVPREVWENATPYTDIEMAIFNIEFTTPTQYPVQMVVKLKMQDVNL